MCDEILAFLRSHMSCDLTVIILVRKDNPSNFVIQLARSTTTSDSRTEMWELFKKRKGLETSIWELQLYEYSYTDGWIKTN